MGFFDTVVVQPIFNLLLVLYGLIGDFGVAIIVFSIIAKLLLWPLTKKQLHQTRLMRKLQPELVEIKKNAKGNRQVESMQMMELYKKHNVKPFGSILVLIIQLPLFIALYRVVLMTMQNPDVVEKYAYGLVKNIGRVAEIINHADQFHPQLFGFIDLTQRATSSPTTFSSVFTLLMVLIAVGIQYYIARQQMAKAKNKRKLSEIFKESADGKQVDQSEINGVVSSSMSKFLPIMMFFIFINIFGAAVLYLLTTNVMTLLQQSKVFRQDQDEMEEIADKKILKDLSKIEEGEVVAKPQEKQKYNVTKISASNKRRKK
jgi:YidC/Oxa1 family membrane protein insertase